MHTTVMTQGGSPGLFHRLKESLSARGLKLLLPAVALLMVGGVAVYAGFQFRPAEARLAHQPPAGGPQPVRTESTSAIVPVVDREPEPEPERSRHEHRSEVSPREALPPNPKPVPMAEVTKETRVPVLMYHEVGIGPNNLYVAQQELANHLDWLKRQGYTTITLAQLYQGLIKGEPIPEKSVVLTFDDGYSSFYATAAPMLKERGFTATLFVITDFVGMPGFITWDQARELVRDGFEMGAHTLSHPDLTVVGAERLKREVGQSKKVLEEELGIMVQFFCYPAGRHNDAVVTATSQAGYVGAVTTVYGAATPAQNPLVWQRVRISKGASAQAFAGQIRAAEGK